MATKTELLKQIKGLQQDKKTLIEVVEQKETIIEEVRERLHLEEEKQKFSLPNHFDTLRYNSAFEDLFKQINLIYIEDLEQFIKDQIS